MMLNISCIYFIYLHRVLLCFFIFTSFSLRRRRKNLRKNEFQKLKLFIFYLRSKARIALSAACCS